jgi:hypothetical protein
VTDWAPRLGALARPGGADALQAAHVVGTVFVGYLVPGTAGFGSVLVACRCWLGCGRSRSSCRCCC